MTGRPWRSFVAPAAALLAATLVVALVRTGMNDRSGATKTPRKTPAAHVKPTVRVAAKRVYVVRAGDTLTTIAASTGVSVAQLQRLNPQVEPTSLFIGDKIRLR